ncbi:HD domain-containing protein [Patescibacteria group bacterium]|nr:HD domain-containing protein [Patescibacteria group bacterium]MDE1946672.1 HD domain-containing protein [Patescibacteria group bacterium]MDE2010625.1 HD domain-containing protein [Patescibacteria group bacterium]
MNKSAIPAEVINTVETLENAGFQTYLVGGCVRDLLLGKIPKDWDITTNANPEQIQGLFTKTVYENIYGTVVVINELTEDETVKNIEVTPYRLESGYSDRRHPDQVKFSDKIEDDLKRRDFTVNAMAVSLSKGAIKDIIDLHGGFNDLKDKKIRTVGNPSDRFNEDALRMMRAVRLAVELDFSIEKSTFEAIRQLNSLLKEIAIERIRDEFVKIIKSSQPKKGLELLAELKLLDQFLPELGKSIGVTQNQAHKYDVWEHLLRSLQAAADKDYGLELRLAALFHDISKPITKDISHETGQITFYNHEMYGSRETRKILERMRFSHETTEKVSKLVRWHMFFSDTNIVTISAVRRLISNVGKDNVWDLMNLRICDRVGTGRPKENPYRLRKYKSMVEEAMRDPVTLKMLKINGDRIKELTELVQSLAVGYILYALFDEVLDNPELNTKEYLEKRTFELMKLPENELRARGEKGRTKKVEVEQKDIGKIRAKYHVL